MINFNKLDLKDITIMLALLNITFIGAFMNVFAMEANDWRMPVYAPKSVPDDVKHFTFQDKSSVNLFYLTDIVYLQTEKGGMYLSIGDFILVLGGISLVIFSSDVFIRRVILIAGRRRKK